MITAEQIQITSDLVYEGCGLAVRYEIHGKGGFTFLPDEKIMSILQEDGYIAEHNVKTRTVCVKTDSPISMEYFMKNYLDVKMAQTLIAAYLNDQTDKKSGNYKSYTI